MAASAARRISGSSLRGTLRTVSSSPSPRMTEGREPSVTRSPTGAAGGRLAAVCSGTSGALSRDGSATPPRFSLGGPGSSGSRVVGVAGAGASAADRAGFPVACSDPVLTSSFHVSTTPSSLLDDVLGLPPAFSQYTLIALLVCPPGSIWASTETWSPRLNLGAFTSSPDL